MNRLIQAAIGLAAIGSALLLTPGAADAAGPLDGTYEYVSPGWRGVLLVQEGTDGQTHFYVYTEKQPFTCEISGAAEVEGDSFDFTDAESGLDMTVRFFDTNAEIDARGPLPVTCDVGAQIGGVYIRINRAVRLNPSTVEAVQYRLNELGYAAGSVDGVVGRRTRTALAGFQRDWRLPDTGGLTLEAVQQVNDAFDQRFGVATAPVEPAVVTEAPLDDLAEAVAGDEADATPAADVETTALTFTSRIPSAYIDWLDRLYADEVAPQQIDWDNAPFEVALIDLDETPTPGRVQTEIVVFWNDAAFCGEDGCRAEVLRHDGDAYVPVMETSADVIALGEGHTNGMRDILVDGADRWTWNGSAYTQDLYKPQRVR